MEPSIGIPQLSDERGWNSCPAGPRVFVIVQSTALLEQVLSLQYQVFSFQPLQAAEVLLNKQKHRRTAMNYKAMLRISIFQFVQHQHG